MHIDTQREKLRLEMINAINSPQVEVIWAPTSIGKSFTAATLPLYLSEEVTGEDPLVFLSENKQARDEAAMWARDAGLEVKILVGNADRCPLFRGEYDCGNEQGNRPVIAPGGGDPSEYYHDQCIKRGLSADIVHSNIEAYHPDVLPCCEDGECKLFTKRDYTDLSEYDIVIATHHFALVNSLIENRIVIIDELPETYSRDINSVQFEHSVNDFFKIVDANTNLTYKKLLTAVPKGEEDILDAARLTSRQQLSSEWYRNGRNGNVDIPGFIQAVATATQRLEDRWVGEVEFERPDLYYGNGDSTTKSNIRVVIDELATVREYQILPQFKRAKSVVGLDATPVEEIWKMYVSEDLKVRSLLSPQELHELRRENRNLKIVQVGNSVNSLTRKVKPRKRNKIERAIWYLARQYPDEFRSAITSKAARSSIEVIMESCGIDEPNLNTHGNLKSDNSFKNESVGLVAGCISLSSEKVKDWLAIRGLEAYPRWDDDSSHQYHEYDGRDADEAFEFLASVRENGLIQAAGRYARQPDDPDDGAVVYVMSSVMPDDYVDEYIEVPPVDTDKQRAVFDAINGSTRTANEILDLVDSEESNVYDLLNRFVELGLATREKSNRPGTPYVFSATPVGESTRISA